MARVDLKRLLRGAQKRAVEDAITLFGRPARVEDTSGRVLVGDASAEGTRHAISIDGTVFGELIGPDDAGALVRLVEHLAARELEKRSLAAETLDRYKELTLLYDMSDQLSKLLELDEVAQHVVEQADRHLRADDVVLFLSQPGSDELIQAAVLGHEEGIGAGDVCHRVFSTGRSELVELDGRLVLAAPLRHGDEVFGVLRASQDGTSGWTAGDLKLVTAVAANAASALRKAQLHARQVRDIALRHQVQRHVSSDFVEALFDGGRIDTEPLAVLFCDLRSVSTLSDGAAPDELVQDVEEAVAEALHLLMQHGAVVDLPLGEMLVAVFHELDDFPSAAHNALTAATAVARRLASRAPIGIGVTSGSLPTDRATEALHGLVHSAARLQEDAAGAVLTDQAVTAAAGPAFVYTPRNATSDAPVFEVRTP